MIMDSSRMIVRMDISVRLRELSQLGFKDGGSVSVKVTLWRDALRRMGVMGIVVKLVTCQQNVRKDKEMVSAPNGDVDVHVNAL